jgi:hypothetical protein
MFDDENAAFAKIMIEKTILENCSLMYNKAERRRF